MTSPFDYTGPSSIGPNEREKGAMKERAKKIRQQVPDARGSNPVNLYSPKSISIGGKTDEGKLARLAKGRTI